MSKQDEKILEAAVRVFMRYGIRRTTMNDIANEAGLVRQTLYTAYKSKDEVLCAAIRFYSDRALTAIRAGWKDADTFGEKLDVYFEHAIIASFAMVRASPDADDIVSGYNAAGKAEIRRVQAKKRDAIAGILIPYEARIIRTGLTVTQLADFIQNAAENFKNSARDEKHLRSLLAALKAAVLSLSGE